MTKLWYYGQKLWYYGKNNENENHTQRLSFKQKSSLVSADELKDYIKLKTIFTFKILFIDIIDHAFT